LYRIHQRRLIICVIYSLVQIVLCFLPSFILMMLLRAITAKDIAQGMVLVFLIFMFPVINAFVEHQFAAFMGTLSLRVESAIQTAIYQKLLRINTNQYQKMKTGQICSENILFVAVPTHDHLGLFGIVLFHR
jgi:ABC-type bacteriocin/lantibiotic exporter with double-glycine peptidase domain